MTADVVALRPPSSTRPAHYPVSRPIDVLPHPRHLACMVAWDTETSGLWVDEGSRIAVVSVAFYDKRDPTRMRKWAFPFDQGRAADKGFEPLLNARGVLRLNASCKWKPGEELPVGFMVDPDHPQRAILDMVPWEREVNLGESDWKDLMRWLRLAGEHVGLLAHHLKHDLHQTRAGTREWPGEDLEMVSAYCSMVGQAVLDPKGLKALKPVSTRLWGEEVGGEAELLRTYLTLNKKLYGLKKDDGPRYDLLPWDIIGPYASQDAVLALMLAIYQTDRFADGDAPWAEVEKQVDLTRLLYRVERRGYGDFDFQQADHDARLIEDRISELEQIMPFQPPTLYRAKEYFFDVLGLRPWQGGEDRRNISIFPGANKDGSDKKVIHKQGSLTIAVATRMAAADVEYAAEFAELIRLRTANQMHYRGFCNLVGPDKRIRTSYKQGDVRSGRLSVERFQAVAIPRRSSVLITLNNKPLTHPRDFFEVPPGRTRITMDLAQAELRVAAQFAGCGEMIEEVRNGTDIHGRMTTTVWGLKPTDDDFKAKRYFAKRCVFCSIFAGGAKTLQDTIFKDSGLMIPFSEAKRLIDTFRATYPEFQIAYNEFEQFVYQNGYVELVDGSRSHFGPRDYERTAWSRRVQGSLAVFFRQWLLRTEAETGHWDALVLMVHDSVTLDLPSEIAWEYVAKNKADTEREFEETFGIPGLVDCEEGF